MSKYHNEEVVQGPDPSNNSPAPLHGPLTPAVYTGDCREFLPTLPEKYFHSIVTDPPYEIGFAQKDWDKSGVAFDPETWRAHLRVLRPGGHLLAFGGTRTIHRIMVAIEDAGFEIRDQIFWCYATGAPAGTNISKRIDQHLGAKRIQIRHPGNEIRNPKIIKAGKGLKGDLASFDRPYMKKAREDGYRDMDSDIPATPQAAKHDGEHTGLKPAVEPICVARRPLEGSVASNVLRWDTGGFHAKRSAVGGRFPANLMIDDTVAQLIELLGGPSRIFFCKKASGKERTCGGAIECEHPTIKPLSLMYYLLRLVTPPGGTTGDFFLGSGTTGMAAVYAGMHLIGCELDPEYAEIARKRMGFAVSEIEANRAGITALDRYHGQLGLFDEKKGKKQKS